MVQLSTNDLYEIIMDKKSLVWSPKSGLAPAGQYKVIMPRTERLHRVRNFTIYRMEEYMKFHRSTLSDFEYDYYLSVGFISDDVVVMDICQIFEHKAAAAEFVRRKDDPANYSVEKI